MDSEEEMKMTLKKERKKQRDAKIQKHPKE